MACSATSLEDLIEREGADTIGAFNAEPLMASGGCIVPQPGYYDKIETVLRGYDIFFIADEVICGFGPTGNMFGCESFGIRPGHDGDGQAAFRCLSVDLGAHDQ